MSTIPSDSYSPYQGQGIDFIHSSRAGCNLQNALAVTCVALSALGLIGAIILNIAYGCDMGPLSPFAYSIGLTGTCTTLAACGLLFILSLIEIARQATQVTKPETEPTLAPPVFPEAVPLCSPLQVVPQSIIRPHPEAESDFEIRIKNHQRNGSLSQFRCPKTIKVHEGISAMKELCGDDDFALVFCNIKLLDSRNPSESADLESNFVDWLAEHGCESNDRIHLVQPDFDLISADSLNQLF